MPVPTSTPSAPALAAGATVRRVPLKRCYAFYDLRTARRIPLTRQFTFTNVHALPGAFNGAAAPAQTSSAARAQQPSAGLGNTVAALLAAPAKRKHTHSDNDLEAGDAKRRRVEPNAQPPSRAAGKTTGNPASASTTGATASKHYISTATAASSAARDALKNPTKPTATGKHLRPILKMPKRPVASQLSASIFTNDAGQATQAAAVRPAPSKTRRVRFATLPSVPSQSPETKRVHHKRTDFGSNACEEDKQKYDVVTA